MTTSIQSLTVEVWSDFACPWCWIAKHRFEMALANFKHRDQIKVNHRAYRLAIGQRPMPIKAVLLKKFGNHRSVDDFVNSIQTHAEATGLVYNFDTLLFGDTTAVHALVKAADRLDVSQALIENLYEASITRGVSLYDLDSIAVEAAKLDIPKEFVKNAWTNSELIRLITKDESTAKSFGSGVPLFQLAKSCTISGAQSVEVFTQSLEQMYSSATSSLSYQGMTCDLSGCEG
ncbi:DsbA family oxidoreductase [Pseudomonas putida]|uniref:DsbA family oxidoreductase n=1 Tax=Pseudomonas putida TaxID=303 RepID=UPI0039E0131F